MALTATATHRAGEIACDELLFDKLRSLRRQLADQLNVPAYIVFSDVALRQMARSHPQDDPAFLEEIKAHLQSSLRQIFAEESFGGANGGRRA